MNARQRQAAATRGLHVLEGIFGEEVRATACDYLKLQAEIGELRLGDNHVPNAYVRYGDALMEVLLERARERVEEAVGTSLFPTHSYVRMYRQGQRLSPHRDREACEYTMTVTLGVEAPAPWPLILALADGEQAVALPPGDGLIYPGAACEHWRDPFEGSWQVQLTLHYVDRDGPHAQWLYDKRPGLGHHSGSRRA